MPERHHTRGCPTFLTMAARSGTNNTWGRSRARRTIASYEVERLFANTRLNQAIVDRVVCGRMESQPVVISRKI